MARLGHLSVLLTVLACVLVLTLLVGSTEALEAREYSLGMTAVEPPRRPEHFRNIEELNRYLAELRQYYTILGRPRFGRSTDRLVQMAAASHRKYGHIKPLH